MKNEFTVAKQIFDKYGSGPESIESVAHSLESWLGWKYEKAVKILKNITENKDDKLQQKIGRLLIAAEFSEADHPRAPAGTEHGGEFVCRRCQGIFPTSEKESHLDSHTNEPPRKTRTFNKRFTTANVDKIDRLFSERNDPRDLARKLRDEIELEIFGSNNHKEYSMEVINSWNVPDDVLDEAKIPRIADKPVTTLEDFQKFAKSGASKILEEMKPKELVEEYKRQYAPDYVLKKTFDDGESYLKSPDSDGAIEEDEIKIDKPHVYVGGDFVEKGHVFTSAERKKMYITEMIFGKQDTVHEIPNEDLDEYINRWDTFASHNRDAPIVRRINDIETKYGTAWNDKWKKIYDTTPSFFRGTKGLDELDDYLATGKIGGEKNGYNYVAVTAEPEKASEFSDGVIFEYDGDSVRQYGDMVRYTFNPVAKGQSSSINNIESMDRPMHVGYSKELEVRLPEKLPVKNLRVKKMIVNEYVYKNLGMTTEQFKKKYAPITENIVFTNFIFNSQGLWDTLDHPERHMIPFTDRPESKEYKGERDFVERKGYSGLG